MKSFLILLMTSVAFADSPPPIIRFDSPLSKSGTHVSIPAATDSVDGYLTKEDHALIGAGSSSSGSSGVIQVSDGSGSFTSDTSVNVDTTLHALKLGVGSGGDPFNVVGQFSFYVGTYPTAISMLTGNDGSGHNIYGFDFYVDNAINGDFAVRRYNGSTTPVDSLHIRRSTGVIELSAYGAGVMQTDAGGAVSSTTVPDASLAVSYIKEDGSRGLSSDWNAGAHDITAANFVGNLSGNVTGNVSGSSGSTTGNAATVTTNANLSGDVTSIGNATTIGVGVVTSTMLAGSIAYSKLSLSGAILNGDLAGSIAASKLVGTDIASVGTITTGTWNGIKIGLAYGGTNADLSATGGASQVLKQASTGAAVTVGQLACADISNAANSCSTTAASANTNSTIVLRDGSGNFSATTVTAAVTGTASGNLTASPSNHGMLISSGTNAVTVLPPDSSTTKVWTSGGSSADPSWQTPSSGGTTYTANQYGVLYSSATNATATVLAPPTSTIQVLTSGGASAAPLWADLQVRDMVNCSVSAASSAGTTLTIAIKDAAGNDPSTTSPCVIMFRNVTITSGVIAQLSFTAATSLVISGGSALGCTASVACAISVYAVNNAGTLVLGAIGGGVTLDDSIVQTGTVLAGGGADDLAILYTTAAQASKPVKLVGHLLVVPNASFNWNADPVSKRAVASFGSYGKSGVIQVSDGAGFITGDTTAQIDTTNHVVKLSSAPASVGTLSLGTPNDVAISIHSTSDNTFGFNIEVDSSVNGNFAIRRLNGGSAVTAFEIARNSGAWLSKGTISVASVCGTSPSAVTGNSTVGRVTVGTSASSSCTLTFATAYAATPFCTCSDETAATALKCLASTTAVVITGMADSDKVVYHCIGTGT